MRINSPQFLKLVSGHPGIRTPVGLAPETMGLTKPSPCWSPKPRVPSFLGLYRDHLFLCATSDIATDNSQNIYMCCLILPSQQTYRVGNGIKIPELQMRKPRLQLAQQLT